MITTVDVLYPPDEKDSGLLADVDWATATIRMHVAYERWRSSAEQRSGADVIEYQLLSEVITHEFTHVLQMVTTGFAYRYSHMLLREVATALRDEITLDEVYRNSSNHAARLRPAVETIEQVGPAGLRPIDILESTAYLTQKRTHYLEMGAKGYERTLITVADSAYRRAYDVAADILGEDAYDQLPQLAYLSLLTSCPEKAFVALAHAFRDEGSRINRPHNRNVGMRLLRDSFSDYLLGSAADLLASGLVHPVLAPTVRDIRKLVASGTVSEIGLTCRPFDISSDVVDLIVGPMIFPPATGSRQIVMHAPTSWLERSADDSRFEPDDLCLLFAGSALVVNDIEPVRQQRPVRPARDSTHDYTIALRDVSFPKESRTDSGVDAFAEMIGKIESDPSQVRALRGTVAISIPDVDVPLMNEGVRQFFRQLFERIPHLMYFLGDFAGSSALLLCGAAFCDPSDISDSDGRIRLSPTASVVESIVRYFLCAVQYCASLSVDYHWMLHHLEILPDDVAGRMREAAASAYESAGLGAASQVGKTDPQRFSAELHSTLEAVALGEIPLLIADGLDVDHVGDELEVLLQARKLCASSGNVSELFVTFASQPGYLLLTVDAPMTRELQDLVLEYLSARDPITRWAASASLDLSSEHRLILLTYSVILEMLPPSVAGRLREMCTSIYVARRNG